MAMVRLACDSHASIIVQFTDFYRISIISEILDKVRKQNNTLKIYFYYTYFESKEANFQDYDLFIYLL